MYTPLDSSSATMKGPSHFGFSFPSLKVRQRTRSPLLKDLRLMIFFLWRKAWKLYSDIMMVSLFFELIKGMRELKSVTSEHGFKPEINGNQSFNS